MAKIKLYPAPDDFTKVYQRAYDFLSDNHPDATLNCYKQNIEIQIYDYGHDLTFVVDNMVADEVYDPCVTPCEVEL